MGIITLKKPSLILPQMSSPAFVYPGAAEEDNIIFSDTFNRADTATGLGIADTGQPWIYPYGTAARWQINAGTAKIISATPSYPCIDAKQANVQIECTVANYVDGGWPIVFRVIDNNNVWQLRCSGTSYSFYKRVASVTSSNLWAGGILLPVNGDKLKIRIKNDVIQIYVNGILRTQRTDSELNTATLVGMGAVTGLNSQFDNYIVTAI
jgi:hypothetical protein